MEVRLLWSTPNPEEMIAAAMRRCYTTKVWEDIQQDVSIPGYAQSLTRGAYDRTEFDVYEHCRMLFSVDGTADEILKLKMRHEYVSLSNLGGNRYAAALNLRTLTEMARKLHCNGEDCKQFVKHLPEISPTIYDCVQNPENAKKRFEGQRPSNVGKSESEPRVIVVQHLTMPDVKKLIDFDLQFDELLKLSFITAEIEGYSRVMSHQLVRHRGWSYSQESQRFSDAVHESFVIPQSIRENPEALRLYTEHMERSKVLYEQLKAEPLKIKKEDARFVLPSAVKTKILMTGSAWHLFHTSFFRSSFSPIGNKAQSEINDVYNKLYSQARLKDELLPAEVWEV